ncbi:MAG: YraN family protein [Dehalococcoidales bacterium]|nr:YraN family protein [Dehalococcoidales bacterium]
MKRQATGALGEKLAADFLKQKGYEILAANYRCPDGEIDIITKHRNTLVFVEVRTRSSRKFGTPEESITDTKKEKLRALAERYYQEHADLPDNWRIDVVAVEMGRGGKIKRLEIIENAVEG